MRISCFAYFSQNDCFFISLGALALCWVLISVLESFFHVNSWWSWESQVESFKIMPCQDHDLFLCDLEFLHVYPKCTGSWAIPLYTKPLPLLQHLKCLPRLWLTNEMRLQSPVLLCMLWMVREGFSDLSIVLCIQRRGTLGLPCCSPTQD